MSHGQFTTANLLLFSSAWLASTASGHQEMAFAFAAGLVISSFVRLLETLVSSRRP